MIRLSRKVVRQTNEVIPTTRRALVIELCEGGVAVRIREKGRRSAYVVTYKQIWMMGARIRAEEIRAEKATRKAEAKAARRRG